jgi:hypothetical protein
VGGHPRQQPSHVGHFSPQAQHHLYQLHTPHNTTQGELLLFWHATTGLRLTDEPSVLHGLGVLGLEADLEYGTFRFVFLTLYLKKKYLSPLHPPLCCLLRGCTGLMDAVEATTSGTFVCPLGFSPCRCRRQPLYCLLVGVSKVLPPPPPLLLLLLLPAFDFALLSPYNGCCCHLH